MMKDRFWYEILNEEAAHTVVSANGIAAEKSSEPDAANRNPLILLIDATAERLQMADGVAASKFTNHQPVDDSKREQQVLHAVAAQAIEHGIDGSYVIDVFRKQMEVASAVQHVRIAQWKLDPVNAPTAAPDLSAIRAAIDSIDRIVVREIGIQWRALNSAMSKAYLEGARRTAISRRMLAPMYQQALAAAARVYGKLPSPHDTILHASSDR